MEVVACQDRVDHVSITLDGLKHEERFHRGLNGDANRRLPMPRTISKGRWRLPAPLSLPTY
jgi:hypothetical protein